MLSGVAALAVPPASTPGTATSPSSALTLAQDARLDRAVALDETGISLAELLARFSQNGLTLEADRACAAQKLQIHLKQRPLRTLMQALAQLLSGTWEPLKDQSGYRLEMDAIAVSRRGRWWALYLGERERAKAAQRAYILQQMRAEPKPRKPGDPLPD